MRSLSVSRSTSTIAFSIHYCRIPRYADDTAVYLIVRLTAPKLNLSLNDLQKVMLIFLVPVFFVSFASVLLGSVKVFWQSDTWILGIYLSAKPRCVELWKQCTKPHGVSPGSSIPQVFPILSQESLLIYINLNIFSCLASRCFCVSIAFCVHTTTAWLLLYPFGSYWSMQHVFCSQTTLINEGI